MKSVEITPELRRFLRMLVGREARIESLQVAAYEFHVSYITPGGKDAKQVVAKWSLVSEQDVD